MNFRDYTKINQKNATVIGLQFGDEGKGKVVDLLAKDFDYVVRFQGGDNAGHTIVIDGVTHKLSLIPSGVFHGKKAVLGSGVVINPYKLKEEIDKLEESGIDLKGKLFVSDNASIIFSINKKLDVLNEKLRCDRPIGTTGKGIGVSYTHRVSRNGVRVCDLFGDQAELEIVLSAMIEEYELIAIFAKEKIELYNITDVLKEVDDFKRILEFFIVNTAELFNNVIRKGEKVLCEGAQGCGLDVNHGTYPFVTSSSTFAAQVALGVPMSFHNIGKIYGVLKAYSTRVGRGILVTENHTDDKDKDEMQSVGQEFGTVTGRIRRCGWLDLVATKSYINTNGVSAVILTKIDILDGFKNLKICVGYNINGEECGDLPSIINNDIEPIYREFEGWNVSTVGTRKYDELPENTKKYIEFIEEFLETKIEIVSNGSSRDDVIYR